jgi:phosphomannomutase
MKELVAFDLDGTLAESKQPLQEPMGEALADLLDVAHVAVISGGDWPQAVCPSAPIAPSCG